MTLYILKSAFCLGILLAVYLLFLEKEKMHRFNRWYLLLSIAASFVVPLIRFTITRTGLPALEQQDPGLITAFPNNAIPSQAGNAPAATPGVPASLATPLLLMVYAAITMVLLSRFCRNIYLLIASAMAHKAVSYKGAQLVLLKETTASFSFLHYIFISEQDFTNRSIEEELITHELTHVKEKHSWDVLFVELLQSIFWFNPLFRFYKQAIQRNHEYLADEAVIRKHEDVPAYQALLLDKACLNNNIGLTSNFNYSITKKRLIMLTIPHKPLRAALKKMAVLPVVASMVLVFSSKNIVTAQDKKQEKTQSKKTETVNDASLKLPEVLMVGDVPVTSTTGLSAQQLSQFNQLRDATIVTPDRKTNREGRFTGTPAQRDQLFNFYKDMNREQRNQSQIAFTKKYQMPKKTVPTEEQFEKWKNAAYYGLWIDGKKVSNDVLNKYKASDFSYFSVSNLYYTEKMKANVMKTFNLDRMYEKQLDVYTNAHYEKWKANHDAEPEYSLFHSNVGYDEVKKRPFNHRTLLREGK